MAGGGGGVGGDAAVVSRLESTSFEKGGSLLPRLPGRLQQQQEEEEEETAGLEGRREKRKLSRSYGTHCAALQASHACREVHMLVT